jgi:hypothetical protein
MKYLYKHTPELILLIYIGLFLGFKDIDQRWDRAINSDGKGYYAYLPAIFIYNDLQYTFVENYEWQYYPTNKSVFKEFRQPSGDRVANKYFPGLAILWLPFFLLAHLFAWLEIFPRDGYSYPYQLMIALSAIWFLWMGARWLQRLLLRFGASLKNSAFITLAVTLGTNLIFFTIVEGSMSHVYSFALITLFCLTAWKMFHEYRPKWFVRSLLLYLLIILIRPTNALIIILLPLLAGTTETLSITLKRIIASKATLIRGAILALILISIPFVLWYLQTGQPVVYTYGEEKLNLLRPYMANILFSFNRGWFIYTPIAFIAMFGFIGLYKRSRIQFYSLLAFLLLFVYILSCWWAWYFASKCGQRSFIDIYVVVGLLLMFLYDAIPGMAGRRVLSGVIILFIGLNIFQFWQHTRWIYPPVTITGEIYRDALFSLHQKARVYLPNDGIELIKSFENDMESDKGITWMNPITRNDTLPHQGKWSSRTNLKIPYSVGLEVKLDTLFTTMNRVVRVRAWVFSKKITPESSLVVDFQKEGKSVSYNAFLLEKFAPADEWTEVESAFYVPDDIPDKGSVKIYFYNPSKHYNFYVDDLRVDFISLKNDPEYHKVEGVLLPNKVVH